MPVLTWIVLGVHIVIIAFNVTGLVLIPLGTWHRWRWVRGFCWRLEHLLILGVVASRPWTGARVC